MFGTAFGVHHEDSNMGSMNCLHSGKPKTWYSIPSSQANKLEDFVQGEAKRTYNCDKFIRHKSTMIPPSVLRSNGIEFGKVKTLFINYIQLHISEQALYVFFYFILLLLFLFLTLIILETYQITKKYYSY